MEEIERHIIPTQILVDTTHLLPNHAFYIFLIKKLVTHTNKLLRT
jgi:hypothetical protein